MHLLLSTPAFTSLHSIWKSSPLPARFPFLGTHFDGDLDPLRPRAGKKSPFSASAAARGECLGVSQQGCSPLEQRPAASTAPELVRTLPPHILEAFPFQPAASEPFPLNNCNSRPLDSVF